MQSMNSYDKESFEVYDSEVERNITDHLAYETPVGWSSICLDQTINYYIDCNLNIVQNRSTNS